MVFFDKIFCIVFSVKLKKSSNNLILSKKRAEAVALYLNQRGVQMDRLVIQYFGEEKPIYNNDTEEGRQKNRRVEMTIIFE